MEFKHIEIGETFSYMSKNWVKVSESEASILGSTAVKPIFAGAYVQPFSATLAAMD